MFNKEGSFVVKKSEYDIRGQYRDACIVKALYAEKNIENETNLLNNKMFPKQFLFPFQLQEVEK